MYVVYYNFVSNLQNYFFSYFVYEILINFFFLVYSNLIWINEITKK